MSHKSYIAIIFILGVLLLLLGAGPLGYTDDDIRLLATRIFNASIWWIACELYEHFWLTKRFKVSELIAGQTEKPKNGHQEAKVDYDLQQQIHLASVRLAIAVYTGCKWVGSAFVFGISGS